MSRPRSHDVSSARAAERRRRAPEPSASAFAAGGAAPPDAAAVPRFGVLIALAALPLAVALAASHPVAALVAPAAVAGALVQRWYDARLGAASDRDQRTHRTGGAAGE